jgi:hypothetical protein
MKRNLYYSWYGVLLCFFGTVASNGLIIQPRMIYESVCDRRRYTDSNTRWSVNNNSRTTTFFHEKSYKEHPLNELEPFRLEFLDYNETYDTTHEMCWILSIKECCWNMSRKFVFISPNGITNNLKIRHR